MALDGYTTLSFDRPAEGVLVVVLDRPEQLNATDAVMHTELSRVWRDVSEDEASRAVVLTGRGRAFSAGGDLEGIARQAGDFDVVVRMMDEAAAIVRGMLDCTKPVVSAVQG